ncbi:FTR1 family protein [Mesonia sp. MT50]|uniref:FTR1 family protein n=1 Tax=Mesonia profundi TaxID=3070998 RepID=A0ABU1A0H1_9FLAO|nr:FTR1 family protein [Mesonia profundi]MDQ7917193.1 FTR1 family protein [Mesonia profundi]
MFKVLSSTILLVVILIFTPINKVFSQNDDTSTQTVIHLLGYIARDYAEGVQDGKIIDEQEYSEMKEFSAQAYRLTKEGDFLSEEDQNILDEMQELRTLIADKKSAKEINTSAVKLKNDIIKVTGVETAPKIWPDVKVGKSLFQQNCASCHGANGNGQGELAKGLEPAPTNFYDAELMGQVSPFQAYNTVKLGVQGTSMQAFSESFNEQELWALAFYVKSLRFEDKTADSLLLRKEFKEVFSYISLKDIATLSDDELLAAIAEKTDNPKVKLEAVRLLAPVGENATNSLSVAEKNLRAAVKNYSEGNKKLARNNALNAYLEGIEPVEARLRANDPSFVIELEQQMLQVRQVIEKGKGTDAVKVEAEKALVLITQADQLLQDQKLNYWLTFILALSIMLREGLEAFLILAVVLALIRSSGVKKALPWLHGGWIAAVLMGIAGWFLSDYIIQFGGKNREIMEGLVSLLAVLVLLFVGFWLHNNSTAKKWKEFVEGKIGRYLQKDKMFGLAIFSFMVVFREAFEVILFLQAIRLEAAPGDKSAIGLGVLVAVVCIALMAHLFLKYSKRIPVRQLFQYSSWVIILLAIILMGKGVHSIQESGWISVTGIGTSFRIGWLGFYPTLETVLAQAALIGVVFITYFMHNQGIKKVALK